MGEAVGTGVVGLGVGDAVANITLPEASVVKGTPDQPSVVKVAEWSPAGRDGTGISGVLPGIVLLAGKIGTSEVLSLGTPSIAVPVVSAGQHSSPS